MMLNVALGTGDFHGWGIAGKNIAQELNRITNAHHVTATSGLVDGPFLQGVTGANLIPFVNQRSKNHPNVGYCFIENPAMTRPWVKTGTWWWDHLVAGSTWCAEQLRAIGLPSVSVAVQGVDTALFKPSPKPRQDDRFVVIGAGKPEYRKGTDIAIKAFKIFSDRHKDAFLLAAWGNPWIDNMATLKQSPYYRYEHLGKDCRENLTSLMRLAGIAPDRYELLDLMPNWEMPKVYQRGDVGLFPSRCEAGTSLPMMECMACETPVITNYATGLIDVLDEDSQMVIRNGKYCKDGWFEPCLETVVATLEWSYRNRERLQGIGMQARLRMHDFPWSSTAATLYRECMVRRRSVVGV